MIEERVTLLQDECLRIAVSEQTKAPISSLSALIGKEETLRRIDTALRDF